MMSPVVETRRNLYDLDLVGNVHHNHPLLLALSVTHGLNHLLIVVSSGGQKLPAWNTQER